MTDQRSAEAQAYRRWYKTSRWQKLRAQQLKSEPLCRMCLVQHHYTPANVCDHIEPHKGDPIKFWSGPFQSLCKRHHDSTKQSQERGRQRAEIGLDGWPIDA
jgi:5-methylcytosine-specific restriction enzyme A